jgi:threonine dehydratase
MVDPVMNHAAILAAAERLAPVAVRTPLLESDLLNAATGRRVLVKAESLQRTGSFKFRGAWNALSLRPPGEGIIAFSSGNHAQGVALAARLQGRPCVIIMPADAPVTKVAGTRAHGAEVVLYDRLTQDRDAIGAELAAARGLHLVRPFDDADVIAGQGTCGLEIAAQAAAAGVTGGDVVVCCGGGGLATGIALALEGTGFRVRTAEPAGHDDMARSLATGVAQNNAGAGPTLCDAIMTPAPGQLTLPILAQLAGPGLAATDDQVLRAMALAFIHLRLVLEPGGACALACALALPGTDPVICTASGGNVDPAIFMQALNFA